MQVPPFNPMFAGGDHLRGQGDPTPTSLMQGAGFQPLRIYDTPAVLANQLVHGDLTLKSIRDAFFRPNDLTPKERMTLGDSAAASMGGGKLARGFFNVLLNPLVWGMFLMAPVGAKALMENKSFFAVAQKWASQAMEHLPWWSQLGSVLENMEGTSANAITQGVTRVLGSRMREEELLLRDAKNRLLRKLNDHLGVREGEAQLIKSLNIEDHKPGTREWALLRNVDRGLQLVATGALEGTPRRVQEMKTAIQRWEGGAWVDHPHPDPAAGQEEIVAYYKRLAETVKGQKDAFLAQTLGSGGQAPSASALRDRFGGYRLMRTVDTSEVPTTALADDAGVAVKKFLAEVGGDELRAYMAADQKAKHLDLIRTLLDEGHLKKTGELRADRRKISMVVGELDRQLSKEGWGGVSAGATSLQGKEAMLNLLGQERFTQLMDGDLDQQERFDLLFKHVEDFVIPPVQRALEGKKFWSPMNNLRPIAVQSGGQKHRPMGGGADNVDAVTMDQAPRSASAVMVDRIMPVTSKEIIWDPEELEDLPEGWIGKEGLKALKNNRRYAQRVFEKENGRAVMGHGLSYFNSARRYSVGMKQLQAWGITPVHEGALLADAEMVKMTPSHRRVHKTSKAGIGEFSMAEDFLGLPEEHKKYISYGDLMDRVYMSQAPDRRHLVSEYLVPGALQQSGPKWMAQYNSRMQTKALAGRFAESALGKFVERVHPAGKKFVEEMKELGDWSKPLGDQDWTRGLTKWFYNSHLGINSSSMVMNMLQPLALAATAGTPAQVAEAYGRAFKEVGGYLSDRAAMGKLITDPEAKDALMRKHFRFKEAMQIGTDMDHLLDWQTHHGKGELGDLMMRGFEKSEWFSRSVSAHLYDIVSGGPGKNPHYADDLMRFVQQTQFGGSAVNTPLIFQKGILANPLLRQFFTFPLRSAMGTFFVFPRLGGETSYGRGLARVVLRGMGTSAIVYEAGKGLFNADMSRGLFWGAATDVVGGDKFLGKDQGILPVPPVLDVPLGLIRGLATGDAQELAGAIARTVPGGVAINRALQITGPWDAAPGLQAALRKTYVDWKNPTPDGKYGVYKADGTLIEFRSGSEIVAKGLGVDLGSWQQQGGLDGYLVKQRDQIIQYRQTYLRALGANELSKARGIQKEFQARYGIPLTVNQSQVKSYLNNRVTGRTERILSRIPPEVRGQYNAFAQASGAGANLVGGGLEEGMSPRERDRQRFNAVTPDQIREIMRNQQRASEEKERGHVGVFAGFADDLAFALL